MLYSFLSCELFIPGDHQLYFQYFNFINNVGRNILDHKSMSILLMIFFGWIPKSTIRVKLMLLNYFPN